MESTKATRYYNTHKEECKARVEAWRQDDPTGEKRKKAQINALRTLYRKNHSPRTAVTLYFKLHGDTPESREKSIEEITKELDKFCINVRGKLISQVDGIVQ